MSDTAVREDPNRNLIGGDWVASSGGETYPDRNPADRSDTVGWFQRSTKQDAQDAISAARDAFPGWADTPSIKRGAILHQAAQIMESQRADMARILTREEGKTLAESTGEVQRAIDIFRYFGSMGDANGRTIGSEDPSVVLYTTREPLGVVGLITPWNFPIAIPAWKMAPALLCGNTIVFKPAELTPAIALRLVDALQKAGLPKGVVNLVTGSGRVVGEEMVNSPQVVAVSFTGSYEVGCAISQKTSSSLKRTQLEMGGKNPMIVLADADLELAAEATARGAFAVTGQACTATSRAIVAREIHDEFVGRVIEKAKQIRVGNGLNSGVTMGPTVNEEQLEKDLEYIEIGRQEGARLAHGGRRLSEGEEHSGGWFLEPAVFTEVSNSMRIAREEIFGPVLSVIPADDFDQAVELANDTAFGLTAGICTRDLEKAHVFARRSQAGVIKINRTTVGLSFQAPFGGIKNSSSGTYKEQGREAIDFYSRIKTTYMGYR